jgi:hypothetical protein
MASSIFVGTKSKYLRVHSVLPLTSRTDVQVGTALELNSRLFEFIEGSITNVEIGSNFIRASLGLKMTRVLFYPDDEPEDVNVVGTFTAMSN